MTWRNCPWLPASVVLVAVLACEPPRSASHDLLEPLDRAALDVLAREACPRVLARTFPLEDSASKSTTGELWVRRCSARTTGSSLDIDVDVLGWQWLGAGSWGFEVREYVYFRAAVRASLRASVTTAGARPLLRIWSEALPQVAVHALGRVSARADGGATSLLGVALGIFGNGPNDLATSALRGRVEDLLRTRARSGLEIALAETPAPGVPEAERAELLRETESLFPDGALISGSYAANESTVLRFDVAGGGKALARAVCVSDALQLVDAVVADVPAPATPAPSDVLTLAGQGEVWIEPRPCPWVLVTGCAGRDPVMMSIELARGRPPRPPGRKRWIQATLLAYELDAMDAPLVGFTIQAGDRSASFGQPLTRARSRSVELVAEPVEVSAGGSLSIEARTWKPRDRSVWTAQTTYDRKRIAGGSAVPAAADSQRVRVPLRDDDQVAGWVDIQLRIVEVE